MIYSFLIFAKFTNIYLQAEVVKFKEKTKDWDETKALSYTGEDDE